MTHLNTTIHRRALFRGAAAGLGTLALNSLLQPGLFAAPSKPHFAARAKRVIHLFMNGGPFQADFFDPKPMLEKFAGQRPAEVQLRTERATAGLKIETMRYFDLLGMVPWFLTGRVLRKQSVAPSSTKLYDRFFVPLCEVVDGLSGPRVGKNLICVARKP